MSFVFESAPVIGQTSVASARMLDTRQVAEMLNITPGTLNVMRVKGIGPSYLKLGGKLVRYRHADVEAWLSGCQRHSTSEQS